MFASIIFTLFLRACSSGFFFTSRSSELSFLVPGTARDRVFFFFHLDSKYLLPLTANQFESKLIRFHIFSLFSMIVRTGATLRQKYQGVKNFTLVAHWKHSCSSKLQDYFCICFQRLLIDMTMSINPALWSSVVEISALCCIFGHF